jgi:hypothetical protein
VDDLARCCLHHDVLEVFILHVVRNLLGHFFGNSLGLLLGRQLHPLRVTPINDSAQCIVKRPISSGPIATAGDGGLIWNRR